MNNQIIETLPKQFSGQKQFLITQGNDFICEMFDRFGYIKNILTTKQIAEKMSIQYGGLTTRYVKTRAAISYLIAEGQITGEPQIFKVYTGHVSFHEIKS